MSVTNATGELLDERAASLPRKAERDRELDRLARIYSWDMKPDEARRWPHRLLRRVMDVGTLDDIVLMERHIGREELKRALDTAEIGSLRPKSWTFWHYRLGQTDPDAPCPPMPTRRMP